MLEHEGNRGPLYLDQNRDTGRDWAYHDSENSSDIVLWEFLLERTQIQFSKTEKNLVLRGVFR